MEKSERKNTRSRRRFLAQTAGLAATGALFPLAPKASASHLPDGLAPQDGVTRTAIRRLRIPRTGELLSVIGLGTARTFDADPKQAPETLTAVMRSFLEWGGSLVDSSPMYGRAEAMVGALCRKVGRDDLFYATKVWTDKGKQAGVEQMTESERLMGTTRFDLMQVHNLVGLDVQLDTLKDWRASGRLRYVGITEMRDMKKVEELVAGGVIDFIQIPYSVTDRRVEDRVLPACIEHGVAALVMQPFRSGRLFGAVKGMEVPAWAADYGASSWAQLFLKFVLGHDAVTLPIPATSKPHHLDDNMAAGLGSDLDAPARAKLIALMEG
ncbi:MAG: aldo/keto reductase [Planctomycetota bacterium]